MQIPVHDVENLRACLMIPQFNENGLEEVKNI